MILVTGGLGFIGSHVVVKLLEANYKVVILDNLSNSDIEILDKIKLITKSTSPSIEFIDGDIRDTKLLCKIFDTNDISFVIHLAALKSVNESQLYPDLYHDVNVNGTLNILNIMDKYDCHNFIYSSSATVYGSIGIANVTENDETGNGLTCNYAINKYTIEQHLIKINKHWNISILRYFNPIGAHSSSMIGENPKGTPNNIFPYLLRLAKAVNNKIDNNVFTIYGNDYDTRDGTCIRDYVHIQDLSAAHLCVLNNYVLSNISGLTVYNIGTGIGTTVLELVTIINDILKEHNKKPINYIYGNRRTGDVDVSCADPNKIYDEIGFKTVHDIRDMCLDGLKYAGLIE